MATSVSTSQMIQELGYKAKVSSEAVNFTITPYINQTPNDKIYIIVKSDNSYFYFTPRYNPNTENINERIVKDFLNKVLRFKNSNVEIASSMEFKKVKGLYKASKDYAEKDFEIEELFMNGAAEKENFIDFDEPEVIYPTTFNVEEYYEKMCESDDLYDGDSCNDENFTK